MEKKNMVLLTVIAVATLLVAVVGATFAYFSTTAQNDFSGGGSAAAGNTSVTSGNVGSGGDTVIITETSTSAGSFTATNVYPGHTEVAQAHVNAKNAAGTSSSLKITYNVTENTFSSGAIKVTLYKSSTNLNLNASNALNCTQQATTSGNDIHYSESCDSVSTVFSSATQVATKTLTTGSETITLTDNESIDASASGTDTYFYIVVEFTETGSDQNTDMSKTLSGNIEFDLV